MLHWKIISMFQVEKFKIIDFESKKRFQLAFTQISSSVVH